MSCTRAILYKVLVATIDISSHHFIILDFLGPFNPEYKTPGLKNIPGTRVVASAAEQSERIMLILFVEIGSIKQEKLYDKLLKYIFIMK